MLKWSFYSGFLFIVSILTSFIFLRNNVLLDFQFFYEVCDILFMFLSLFPPFYSILKLMSVFRHQSLQNFKILITFAKNFKLRVWVSFPVVLLLQFTGCCLSV